jgi:phosphate transport system permease protein
MTATAARRRADLLGQSLTWICAGALALNLLLALGLLLLIAISGLGYFWQQPLVLLTLRDGSLVLGEIHGREDIPRGEGGSGGGTRTRFKVGNRDLYGLDFRWIDDDQIVSQTQPADAVLLERFEWGNFFGQMQSLRRGDEVLASGPDAVWAAFAPLHAEKMRQRAAITALEKGPIGEVNYQIERGRLAERRLALEPISDAKRAERLAGIERQQTALQARYEELAAQLFAARAQLDAETLVMVSADGKEKLIPVGAIVSALRPNAMSTWQTLRLYGRWSS